LISKIHLIDCRDVDDEDVQQRGQPESMAITPVLELEPSVAHIVDGQIADAGAEMAATDLSELPCQPCYFLVVSELS
jgi:hypothetical protein